jgi:hypothetical protein
MLEVGISLNEVQMMTYSRPEDPINTPILGIVSPTAGKEFPLIGLSLLREVLSGALDCCAHSLFRRDAMTSKWPSACCLPSLPVCYPKSPLG